MVVVQGILVLSNLSYVSYKIINEILILPHLIKVPHSWGLGGRPQAISMYPVA